MKQTDLTLAIDEVVQLKMMAIDKLIEELVEPISDIGSPEDLIKKPYEQWTPQDLQMMSTIYGTAEPSPLSNLIFRKKYEEVKELEASEL